MREEVEAKAAVASRLKRSASQTQRFSNAALLKQGDHFMYAWKITYNGEDISDKVGRFSITASLEEYCREMSLDIADKDFYDTLDFSILPETPEIEIFTKIADEFVSQGTFYLERPTLSSSPHSETLQGVWGRSKTAALGEPFAPKVAKTWEEKTTFFAICEEMCDLVGLTWDEAYSEKEDFVIYPYTVQADSVYPIDVLTELATLAGALITTDRDDHLCIKQVDYSPAAADVTVTDPDIQEISESPEWPTFGNRVRITPSGSLAGYSVSLSIPSPCLPADGQTRTKLIAQVKDADGIPVNNLAVTWSIEAENAELAFSTTNTQEIIIEREQQRAKNFYEVDVDFPPSTVDGVFAYSDLARANNLAAAGYTISGNTITLTDPLTYCDQLLVINYRCEGMAVNHVIAGLTTEDVTIMADIEGEIDTGTVYIDNPCECPPSITLKASPSSIHPGEVASLLVYVEESGPATEGRTVFMSESTATKRGTLEWAVARLGLVSITNEQATARNEITGTTQCEISMFPDSVDSVYQADEDGNPTGGDLYASHDGKVIDLSAELETGSALLVNYMAVGAALNRFTGESVGTARINAYISTTREEGSDASVTISVVDVNETIEDQPENWDGDDDDYGGPGGIDDDFDETEGALCHESDGTIKKCAAGERCCWKGMSAFGCFPEAECTTMTVNPCFPHNRSSNPSKTLLASRFADALAHDCTCEEICQNEFSVFGTTQGYDNASYRTITDIVTKDYGFTEGTPEYWEQYETLKQEAIDDCETACESTQLSLAWDEERSADTINPGESVYVYVLHGCPPFHWSLVGKGYRLEAAETASRGNQLFCDDGVCGVDFDPQVDILVTDNCEGAATGVVLNTDAEWKTIWGSNCGNFETHMTYHYLTPKIRMQFHIDSEARGWCVMPLDVVCQGQVYAGSPCTPAGCLTGYDCQEWGCK